MSDNERFSLDAIEQNKRRLEAAKQAARTPEARRAGGRLSALANLPLIIVVLAWLLWSFWR